MASMTSHELKEWVWLLNPFVFPTVYDQLKKYLNTAELLVLSQTSKELGLLRYYTLKKAANVDARLKDFVHDAPLFRAHLGRDNALISGSFALNVFEMGGLKVRKLDIFVQDGPKADHIMFFVSEHEGYRSEDEQDGEVKHQSPKRPEYPCSVFTNSFTASLYYQLYQPVAARRRASHHSNSRATSSTYHDFLIHNSLCQLPLVEQGIFHLSPTHLHSASACSTKIPGR